MSVSASCLAFRNFHFQFLKVRGHVIDCYDFCPKKFRKKYTVDLMASLRPQPSKDPEEQLNTFLVTLLERAM